VATEFRVGCTACAILQGRLKAPGGTIYRDEHWVVDHILSPAAIRGLLIMKLARHREHLTELTEPELIAMGWLMPRVLRAMTVALHPARIYVCSFGETVPHVFWYLIPRYPNMPPVAPDIVRDMFIGRRWACSESEAAAAAVAVRDQLKA